MPKITKESLLAQSVEQPSEPDPKKHARHQLYVLFGQNGVQVTDEIRIRVKEIIDGVV